MGDKFDSITKDPRFQLKKKKKVLANQDDSRFKSVKSQAKPLRDVRGRPWANKPLDYVNSMLENQNSRKISNAMLLKRDNKEEEVDYVSSDSEEEHVYSDESDEDSSSSDEDDNILHDSGESDIEDLIENDWDKLVKGAPTTEESTKRLAVLHFDWHESRPEDLFLVLESFLPKGGYIKSITVYPSQFGMERMAKEREVGPLELHERASGSNEVSDNRTDEDVESRSNVLAARKQFRDYQLNKLKYFYGIVEFDSKESAASVYDQCDCMEYENSGVKLDLRFVDDQETFEVPEEWSDAVHTCNSVDRDKYVPKTFETKALRSTKAYLPWDETPKERQEWFRQGFSMENFDKELDEETLRQYVACSSDEDEEEEVKPKLSSQQARSLLLTNDSTVRSKVNKSDNEDDDEEEDVDDDDELEDDDPVDKAVPRYEAVSAIISDNESECDESEFNPADSHNKKRKLSFKDLPANKRKKSDDSVDEKPLSKKQKRKRKLKEKMEKKLTKDSVKSKMWMDDEVDDRFDEFITDPAFTVSSAHPGYKNSKDFLQYMKKRKAVKEKAS